MDINLSKKNLTKLPDNLPKILNGDFVCSKNDITSLEGSPEEIIGDFVFEGNPELKINEVIKYILKTDNHIKNGRIYYIKSVYSYVVFDFLNEFKDKKDNHERIKIIFKYLGD